MERPEIMDVYTPEEAWGELRARRAAYFDNCAALFSGSHAKLKKTGEYSSFWRRKGKAKVHVPVAADIASTSANLLFGEEPRFSIYDESLGGTEEGGQARLEAIVKGNNLFSKLHEAAETGAALGDVFLKGTYDKERLSMPSVQVVGGADALPEYRLGRLACVHFFTAVKVDSQNHKIWRLYERYAPGEIISRIFYGDAAALGEEMPDALETLGVEETVKTPVRQMLAVHIPNLKPSRVWETDDKGRSDFEGLRDLMDALDETYTSWLRDIRLAKSRLIVPAEFLRRTPDDMFRDGQYTFEFDEDVETLTALDIGGDGAEMKITPSQFAIRSQEHKETYETTLRAIVSMAGYSPQTFGLDINGTAESGTARRVMEKKSLTTNAKKQNYWREPLENFLTALMKLDKALYGNAQFHDDDSVRVEFTDPGATDPAEIASAVNLLHNAQAASTRTLVRMLHPAWSKKEIDEEVASIYTEYGVDAALPDNLAGDGENPQAEA